MGEGSGGDSGGQKMAGTTRPPQVPAQHQVPWPWPQPGRCCCSASASASAASSAHGRVRSRAGAGGDGPPCPMPSPAALHPAPPPPSPIPLRPHAGDTSLSPPELRPRAPDPPAPQHQQVRPCGPRVSPHCVVVIAGAVPSLLCMAIRHKGMATTPQGLGGQGWGRSDGVGARRES